MRVPYDPSQIPPAPRLEITLGAPGEGLGIGPISALIDTGADLCIVPESIAAALDVPSDDVAYLRPSGGDRRRVRIYTFDVGVGEARLPSIEVAADRLETEVILGRNLLNKLVLLLDGPEETVELRGL